MQTFVALSEKRLTKRRRNSAKAQSKAWPGRKPPTTHMPPAPSAAADAGAPTSATIAMMLAGFQQSGLTPGPLLFPERPDLVWALIASLFLAIFLLLMLNLPLVGLWVSLLAIPQPWLFAGFSSSPPWAPSRRAVDRRTVDVGGLWRAGLFDAPVRSSDRARRRRPRPGFRSPKASCAARSPSGSAIPWCCCKARCRQPCSASRWSRCWRRS